MDSFNNRFFAILDATTRPRAIFSWLTDTLALIELWHQRHRSSAQLARIDARVLRDAGISDAQRFAAVNKPFWQQ